MNYRPRPDWHWEAKRLRAEGLKYREIAERLGRPLTTVSAAVNDEGTRTRARKREWDQQHYRGVCKSCGGRTGRREDDRCARCRDEAWATHMAPKYEQVVEWWRDDLLTLDEIAERLDTSRGVVAVLVHRLRARGYDLPHRPPGGLRRKSV